MTTDSESADSHPLKTKLFDSEAHANFFRQNFDVFSHDLDELCQVFEENEAEVN